MLQYPSASVESKSSWAVASVALVTLGMSFGAAWITAVALKDIANEVGGSRSVPALASSLAWLGAGTGGIIIHPWTALAAMDWPRIIHRVNRARGHQRPVVHLR
jgi:hypothetical protein